MNLSKTFGTVAVAALLLVQPAQAKTIHRGTGSAGDRTDIDECQAGTYLVGVSGRGGSWIDQIRILCSPLNADGTLGAHTYEGPVRGGNGGGVMQDECAVGSVINELQVEYTEENRQVKELYWRCLNPTTGASVESRFAGAEDGNFNWDNGIGADRNGCRPGEAATGLVISSGQHVNSVALICDTMVRPAAAAAPATSPISKTGKAIPSGSASSSASAVLVTAFRGSWDTTANGTNHYTLVLQITSPKMTNPFLADLQVVGQFTNTDGYSQYNGTLQGVIRKGTRTLTYSYTQPEANLSGEGVFELSADGNTITGSGTHAGVNFSWNGNRARSDHPN